MISEDNMQTWKKFVCSIIIHYLIQLLLFFQDRDLKQYMDDCGNIMSMNNVKVRDKRYKGESTW